MPRVLLPWHGPESWWLWLMNIHSQGQRGRKTDETLVFFHPNVWVSLRPDLRVLTLPCTGLAVDSGSHALPSLISSASKWEMGLDFSMKGGLWQLPAIHSNAKGLFPNKGCGLWQEGILLCVEPSRRLGPVAYYTSEGSWIQLVSRRVILAK